MCKFALILAAGISAVAFAPAAHAADLIIEEPAPVGVVDVSGNWDGVYLGGFVGYGWGFAEGPEVDLDGWLVGAALGANFTVTEGIVAGVVADIAWSDINDGFVNSSIDWIGSVRGRLGFDGGSFLPYLTAGLAVAGLSYDPTGESETFIGWTAGAGVEFAVTDELSVDLLYRYSDYGDADFIPGTISLTAHQVSIGLNWSF